MVLFVGAGYITFAFLHCNSASVLMVLFYIMVITMYIGPQLTRVMQSSKPEAAIVFGSLCLLYGTLIFLPWLGLVIGVVTPSCPPDQRWFGVPSCPLPHFFGMGVSGILVGLHIPERWFPGQVDTLGNSHNIMHVLTGVGSFIVYNCS